MFLPQYSTFNDTLISDLHVVKASWCEWRGGDSDGDGVCDIDDNCEWTSNPSQTDSDGDRIWDACDSWWVVSNPPSTPRNPCDWFSCGSWKICKSPSDVPWCYCINDRNNNWICDENESLPPARSPIPSLPKLCNDATACNNWVREQCFYPQNYGCWTGKKYCSSTDCPIQPSIPTPTPPTPVPVDPCHRQWWDNNRNGICDNDEIQTPTPMPIPTPWDSCHQDKGKRCTITNRTTQGIVNCNWICEYAWWAWCHQDQWKSCTLVDWISQWKVDCDWRCQWTIIYKPEPTPQPTPQPTPEPTPQPIPVDPCHRQWWDYDWDGVCQYTDNCPWVANSNQKDRDSNGIWDACDILVVPWPIIPIPLPSPDQRREPTPVPVIQPTPAPIPWPRDECHRQWWDSDRDWVCQAYDNCPWVRNTNQADRDWNWIWDACDILVVPTPTYPTPDYWQQPSPVPPANPYSQWSDPRPWTQPGADWICGATSWTCLGGWTVSRYINNRCGQLDTRYCTWPTNVKLYCSSLERCSVNYKSPPQNWTPSYLQPPQADPVPIPLPRPYVPPYQQPSYNAWNNTNNSQVWWWRTKGWYLCNPWFAPNEYWGCKKLW